jgi:hypothetical protein
MGDFVVALGALQRLEAIVAGLGAVDPAERHSLEELQTETAKLQKAFPAWQTVVGSDEERAIRSLVAAGLRAASNAALTVSMAIHASKAEVREALSKASARAISLALATATALEAELAAQRPAAAADAASEPYSLGDEDFERAIWQRFPKALERQLKGDLERRSVAGWRARWWRRAQPPPEIRIEVLQLSYGSMEVLFSAVGLEKYAAVAGMLVPVAVGLLGTYVLRALNEALTGAPDQDLGFIATAAPVDAGGLAAGASALDLARRDWGVVQGSLLVPVLLALAVCVAATLGAWMWSVAPRESGARWMIVRRRC